MLGAEWTYKLLLTPCLRSSVAAAMADSAPPTRDRYISPRGADAHAMRAALEQADTEVRFESRDLVADRRCREMKLRCREREAAPARHGLEGLEIGDGWE
jgi:hypothetical protein